MDYDASNKYVDNVIIKLDCRKICELGITDLYPVIFMHDRINCILYSALGGPYVSFVTIYFKAQHLCQKNLFDRGEKMSLPLSKLLVTTHFI